SSPKLKPIFEMGSGDGVTAARTAVLPPCAAQCNHTTQSSCQKLFFRGKMGRGSVCQQSRDGHPHKRVESIPDQIKGRNFISKADSFRFPPMPSRSLPYYLVVP